MGLCLVARYNLGRFHSERQVRLMMDTYVTISVLGPEKITLPAINLAFKRLEEINVKFNHLNPESPIYTFNHKDKPITDFEIINLVKKALKVSQESGGAFDITIAPLVELWGFYKKASYIPKDEEIKEALRKVGYRHLWPNNGKLEKDDPAIRIDLGGIAKGYALSEAGRVLKEQGVTSAIIDIGGDVYALGRKGGKLWRIGIKDPRRKGLLGYIEAEDLAVISSGDYERVFVKDGKRYHHIFNPRTGYPTEGIAGVTLIYPDPTLAQAWAKVPFVVGAEKGMEMLERIPNMQAIIITDSSQILYSPGFKQPLKLISVVTGREAIYIL